ncbi:MAG TPA: HDIG domain-containing protein [Polyangiaceae bacterium]|nr:HDIG domain-containing protein [Polyangiaceae bacterium]
MVSALFALMLTIIGTFDVLVPLLGPEYGQAAVLALRVSHSARVVRRAEGEVDEVLVEHRRIVVPPGTVLDRSNEDHRAAVEHDRMRRPPSAASLASAFAIYLFALLVLSNYFQRFGHSRLRLMRSQVGLFALMAVTLLIAKVVLVVTALPPFWVPVSAVALWAAVGFDRRTALLTDLALAFLVASLLGFDLLLLAVLLMRGITVALLFFNRKQPRQMLLAGAVSGVVATVAYLALQVLLEGKTHIGQDLASGLDSDLLACLGGGILSGILGNFLRAPAELAMGHVSRARLLDLTDIEAPLLRKMAEEAPGSWEHSRAMANLAEAASASIGADSLLTRVGAYYHDLGKTVQPKYFVENLAPSERSPHEDLPPEVSADAIMAHVVLGTKILREGGVPEPVVEFAYTHHGTQLVEFFWNKYNEQNPPQDENERRLDESHFRYPGMKPMSKETAILMLIDSIEAASRTIDTPDKEKFEEMIRRIVFQKLKSGQLDDSGLTLTDLRILTDRMAATLVNMLHGRIKYPWQREKEKSVHREPADSVKKPAETKSTTREDADKAAMREKLAQAKAELDVKMPPSGQRSRPFELKRLTGEEDDESTPPERSSTPPDPPLTGGAHPPKQAK